MVPTARNKDARKGHGIRHLVQQNAHVFAAEVCYSQIEAAVSIEVRCRYRGGSCSNAGCRLRLKGEVTVAQQYGRCRLVGVGYGEVGVAVRVEVSCSNCYRRFSSDGRRRRLCSESPGAAPFEEIHLAATSTKAVSYSEVEVAVSVEVRSGESSGQGSSSS